MRVFLRTALCLLFIPFYGCMNRSEPIAPKTVLPPPGQNSSVTSLSVTTIEGMDSHTAQKLQKHMRIELARQKIALVTEPRRAAFSLKGYGSVNSDANTTTLVNIWDVHDIKGRRVHRFISEDSGPGNNSRDPWASVNSTLLAKAAKNLAVQYSAWSRGKKLVSPSPIAQPGPSKEPIVTASIPKQQSAPKRASKRPVLDNRTLSAVIAGAPDNRNDVLKRALKAALNSKGYRLSNSRRRAVYRLAVKIDVGAPVSGWQSIAIDWKVSNREGRHLGTVKQRNRIQSSSLNRNWQKTAAGAASAAAGEIINLTR